jgi:hypothetical protein
MVWDDWELTYHQIKHLQKHKLVDDIFVIYSEYSNFGELSPFQYRDVDVEFLNFEPDLKLAPAINERNKRNFALEKAKEYGFTHFLMTDSDEYYEPEPFKKELERFKNDNLLGLVCGLKCYFKLPTLLVPDRTLLPFVHKIIPNLKFEWNTKYPFAFEGPKREIRIDPTRQLNITSGVEMSEITMHHYSWVRSDVKKKIRNSTARNNIEKSTIVADYCNSKDGYYCEFYRTKLAACENPFNIPDLYDESLCLSQAKEPN